MEGRISLDPHLPFARLTTALPAVPIFWRIGEEGRALELQLCCVAAGNS